MNPKTDKNTMLLMIMLGIKEREYEQELFDLQETYHDFHKIRGSYYVHEPFRTWWNMVAERVNGLFLEKITLNADNEYRLHKRDSRGDHFFYGVNDIRKEYFKFLSRHMIGLPANTAVFELCKRKVRVKR